MLLPVSTPLHRLVTAGLRLRRATCSRCWIAQGMFWVCILSCTASLAAAQGGTDVNERFRQATVAMREGHLDQASEGFAVIVKEAPSFAEPFSPSTRRLAHKDGGRPRRCQVDGAPSP